METVPSSPPWQPITFGGVASFARASFGRVFLVQFIVAMLVAASVIYVLIWTWFPALQKAIARLPENSLIRGGQLDWTGPSPARLARNTFLSIIVDPDGESETGPSADVQLEFRRSELRIESLFGYVAVPYPKHWIIALNRPGIEPGWGAWRPYLLIGSAVGVVVWMIAGWLVLATLYSLVLRLTTFYADREASWAGCWRMAAVAVLPGALLMSGAILLYGFHRLDLVGLLFAWFLHVIVGWIYLGIAPTRLPRLGGAPRRRGNPFGGSKKVRR